MPAKKIKTPKILRFRSANAKPEKVFRVTKKKSAPIKAVPAKKKKHHNHRAFSIHTPLSKKVILLTVCGALFVSFVILSYSGKQMLDSIDAAERSATNNTGFSEDTISRLRLIGNEKQYPYEIINFQAAPADLQEFIIKDYRNLKSSCIVNGQFAGAVNYEVSNVVYDKYARITKSCNGTDSLILSKISGIWTVIISGNDLPSCKDVNAFAIPQGISYTCRDGYVTYTNPNP